MQHTLPFRKIPEKIIIRVVNFSVFWIKTNSVSFSVGGILSLTTIITGCTIDFEVHCNLDLGAYAQVRECTHQWNLGEARTLVAVCLVLYGKIQGG